MEINIKALTPLWTGGVESGKCDRIHETGILGSLRWWMEVLVRGMGGNVCDPTEQKCSYKNGLCEVCKIFGAEGQKRRFRLEVVQDNTKPDKNVSPKIELQPYQYQYKDQQGREKTGTRTPTWYFPQNEEDKPRSSTFTVQIQSLHPNFTPEVIGGLIQFIADWSALGARPQMGFGVIQVEGSRIDTQPLHDWLVTTAGSDTYSDLPSLQNIFLAKIQPKASTPPFKEQDTFNLKYDLRKLFRTDVEANDGKDGDGKSRPKKKDRDKDLRHFIMGAVSDDKNNKRDDKTEDKSMAAKIKISRPYNENGTTVMRVWGWIPKEDDCKKDLYKNGWNREKVVEVIYQYLTANYTLHDWCEMSLTRDTEAKNISDAKVFLHSLLKLQETSDAV